MLPLGLLCASLVQPIPTQRHEISRKRKREIAAVPKEHQATPEVASRKRQKTRDNTEKHEVGKQQTTHDAVPKTRQKISAGPAPDDHIKHSVEAQQGAAEKQVDSPQKVDEAKQKGDLVNVKTEESPGKCITRGCPSNSRIGGKCLKHHANQCIADGCTSQAQSGKKCRKHSGVGHCSEPGCTKSAMYKSKCLGHSPRCIEPGCENGAIRAGKCTRHSSYRKKCSEEGCETPSHHGGKCGRHVPRCSVPGCANRSRSGGLCLRHDPKNRCEVLGCEGARHFNRKCWQHIEHNICDIPGCKTRARQRTRRCFRHSDAPGLADAAPDQIPDEPARPPRLPAFGRAALPSLDASIPAG